MSKRNVNKAAASPSAAGWKEDASSYVQLCCALGALWNALTAIFHGDCYRPAHGSARALLSGRGRTRRKRENMAAGSARKTPAGIWAGIWDGNEERTLCDLCRTVTESAHRLRGRVAARATTFSSSARRAEHESAIKLGRFFDAAEKISIFNFFLVRHACAHRLPIYRFLGGGPRPRQDARRVLEHLFE
jgi:hypothetical protein